MVSVPTSLLWCCMGSSCRYRSKCTCLPSNKTSSTMLRFEFHATFTCHKILLFCETVKKAKPILNMQETWDRSQGGLGKSLLIYFCTCLLCVCVCVLTHARVSQCTCGGQRQYSRSALLHPPCGFQESNSGHRAPTIWTISPAHRSLLETLASLSSLPSGDGSHGSVCSGLNYCW